MPLSRRALGASMAAAALVLGACASEAPSAESPKAMAARADLARVVGTGRAAVDDLLSRRDFMMYEVDDVKALHYAEAATLYGAARFAGLTGDEARLQSVTARFERAAAEGVPNTANHVDANVVGVVPLELYRQGQGEGFLGEGLALADGQWADPREDGLTRQTRF